jgi:hypothetical protein
MRVFRQPVMKAKDWGRKVRRYGVEKLKRWLGKGRVVC